MILATMNKQESGTFTGLFRTATVTAPIAVVPTSDRKSDKSPTHRVFARGVRIGAAWARKSKAGRDYLSVQINDPALGQPINAALVSRDDAHTLIWGR